MATVLFAIKVGGRGRGGWGREDGEGFFLRGRGESADDDKWKGKDLWGFFQGGERERERETETERDRDRETETENSETLILKDSSVMTLAGIVAYSLCYTTNHK